MIEKKKNEMKAFFRAFPFSCKFSIVISRFAIVKLFEHAC